MLLLSFVLIKRTEVVGVELRHLITEFINKVIQHVMSMGR